MARTANSCCKAWDVEQAPTGLWLGHRTLVCVGWFESWHSQDCKKVSLGRTDLQQNLSCEKEIIDHASAAWCFKKSSQRKSKVQFPSPPARSLTQVSCLPRKHPSHQAVSQVSQCSHCAKSRQELLHWRYMQHFVTTQTSRSQRCLGRRAFTLTAAGSRGSVSETAWCLCEELDLSSSHPALPSGHKEACNRLQYVLGVSW